MRNSATYAFFVALFAALTLVACAGSTPQVSRQHNQVSETDRRVDDVEARLHGVERDVKEMNGRVDLLREQVAGQNDDYLAAYQQRENQSVIEVTSQDIRINGDSVPYPELATTIDSLHICDGVPLLVASPKADHHKVTWVIEQLYAAGCSKIQLDETGV